MTAPLIIGLGVLALVIWLADGVRRIGAVSAGAVIEHRSGEALLLIDLQSVFWNNGPYSDAAKTDAAAFITAAATAAQAAQIPVIALRQEWSIPSTKAVARLTMKGQALEGSAGVELAAPFVDLPDHVLVKRVQDGFETGELDALLADLDVGRLRIVGLDYNYCVLKTALAAQARGYDVTVLEDGVLSAAPPDKSRQRLIEQAVQIG